MREVEIGTPLREVIELAVPTGLPAAVLVGGYGGTWLGPDALDVPYDPVSLRNVGAGMGAGVLVVLDPSSCGITETARIARYMADESAGQCGPCVFGLPAVASDLESLAAGSALPGTLERMELRCTAIAGRGACRHPDGVVRLVRSAVDVFAKDLAAHLRGEPCAGAAAPTVLRLPRRREEVR